MFRPALAATGVTVTIDRLTHTHTPQAFNALKRFQKYAAAWWK